MKALDALRLVAADMNGPRPAGALTDLAGAVCAASVVWLWVAFLVFGEGGRLLP
ncbi:MAG: hypothetical protein JWO51_1078 [Rhodospirillales bacterium]|nr:hypothetical protein [Rhodospirillales bacterium]